MKKSINVAFSADIEDNLVTKWLSQQYEVTVIKLGNLKSLSNDSSILDNIDLLVLIGGEDVNPEYYNEKLGKFTRINSKRDKSEFEFLQCTNVSYSLINKIPKLGICRGAQLLTVYNGGKLIQHVTGHNSNQQNIELDNGGSIVVSSDHHQMMYPFNLNKENYKLIGWSKNFQSNTYLNGNNEEINLPDNFLEPEIVYYNHTNSLCIQSHPEWCIGEQGSNHLLNILDNCLFNKNVEKYNSYKVL